MIKPTNILFIMADQLRWDYLHHQGMKQINTPNLDKLAAAGTVFTNAFVQSAICGPSRASFYTGRYVSSHGSTWNQVPLPADEMGLGDYLRPLGLKVSLAGKTHMVADKESMDRLAITPDSYEGILSSQAGFDPFIRDDGLHPDQLVNPDLAYNNYLKTQGYDSENPWHSWANAAEGKNGEILSGWYMRHCNKPARIKAEDSETAWLTNQAMEYMKQHQEQPWCLHLSYIKPHWPYMAPEPYFSKYNKTHIPAANRVEAEKETLHPVVEAFMQHAEGVNFAREETRETVIPAYMALIEQLDDELGRLFNFMEQQNLLENTLIIFTSDHGDYLGDHWLGEKELFHDCSCKIPLIISGPGVEKNQTRSELVESIDLIPTFIDMLGADIPHHRLEGKSLKPLLSGEKSGNIPEKWREFTICELDYAHRGARKTLKRHVNECRAWMIRDHEFKFIYYLGYRPQLFNLKNDPDELKDLALDPSHQTTCQIYQNKLFNWMLTGRKQRVTLSDAEVEKRTDTWQSKGIIFGEW